MSASDGHDLDGGGDSDGKDDDGDDSIDDGGGDASNCLLSLDTDFNCSSRTVRFSQITLSLSFHFLGTWIYSFLTISLSHFPAPSFHSLIYLHSAVM